MTKPAIGAVFVNPRGRRYEVIGHTLELREIVVRDCSTGFCDMATWALMVPENGWHQTTTNSESQ